VLIVSLFILAGCSSSQVSTPEGINHSHFPTEINPDGYYLFYLHGKILEDQDLPAVSPEYGEYKFQEILEAFQDEGFIVIGELRAADTDGYQYAEGVAEQVEELLDAGVPAERITIVGASKGAGITIYISHLLKDPDINYVLLAICHPDVLKQLFNDRIHLTGNVLSIYDSVDRYAGSCQTLFEFSEGKGLLAHDEIQLSMELGHGLLYQPYQEWIGPTLEWAKR